MIHLLSFALAGAFGVPVQDDGANWMTYNRNLAGDRFSPLKEITSTNVSRLKPVATFETELKLSFEMGPVVVDGTMFCTTYKHTYAVDASTGKIKWKDVANIPMSGLANNRGVAFDNGLVFRGYGNGEFAAFDASTGNRIWVKKIAHSEAGESMPIAPVAWDGKVYIGNAGGDNRGVTGHIYALDEKTGEQIWQLDTVPTTGFAADTWMNKSLPPAGGATWSTYSIDTNTSILYASVGNPAPDFDVSLRPGQNLFTNCVVALDAKTGKLLAYVQPTKNDEHDWDIAAAPALITTRAGKSIVTVGGKDGMLYGIDNSKANSNESTVMPILYGTPVTRRFNTNAHLTATKSTRFAPGSQGGMEWNGPCYDPTTNLLFAPATDWPVSVKLASREKIMAVQNGKGWSGADDASFGKKDKVWGGFLTAVDADSGKVRWKFKSPAPLVAGVTATAGGLVFCADALGDVRAFASSNGKLLWKYHIGRPCGGGIVTYAVKGHQYLAVVAGPISGIWPGMTTTAEVVIFRL